MGESLLFFVWFRLRFVVTWWFCGALTCKMCVDRPADPDSLFVAIVKMQVHYMDHHIDKHRIIAKHQSSLDEKMQPLIRLIINTRLKSKKECDEYVKMLAVDIIAFYALGNPENAQVRNPFASASIAREMMIFLSAQNLSFAHKKFHFEYIFMINFHVLRAVCLDCGRGKRWFKRP